VRDGIQPELDQRADPLANLQAGDLFGRQGFAHGGIDAADPCLDHLHRPAGKGEDGGFGIDPVELRGITHGGLAPPVEGGGIGNRRGQRHAQIVQAGGFLGHGRAHSFGPKICGPWPGLALGLASLSIVLSNAGLPASLA
jgi:hypothetical protein